MLVIKIAAFHGTIEGACAKVGADAGLVLDAVNEALEGLEADADKSRSKVSVKTSTDRKLGTTMFRFTGTERLTSLKTPDSPALRLAQIHFYLELSAEMYLRVDNITLPQSVETWIRAERFKPSMVPA